MIEQLFAIYNVSGEKGVHEWFVSLTPEQQTECKKTIDSRSHALQPTPDEWLAGFQDSAEKFKKWWDELPLVEKRKFNPSYR